MPVPDASPTTSRLARLRERRTLIIVAGVLAALLVVGIVVAVSQGDDGDGTASKPNASRSSTTTSADARSTTTKATTTTKAKKRSTTTTKPKATTTTAKPRSTTTTTKAEGTPAEGSSGGNGATPGSTPSPTPSTPALPGFSDEDPSAPPPNVPVGPQGPVKPAACRPTGPPKIASSLTDLPSSDGKKWVTVGSASGNCGGSSPSFRTTGIDTRIVVRSDADQILVFLDSVTDPGSNAGYADVICRSRCSDEGVLVNPADTYRLRIQATDGPWVVEVQEYR